MDTPIRVNDYVRINDYDAVPEEYRDKVVGVVFRVSRISDHLPIMELTNDVNGERCVVSHSLVSLVARKEEMNFHDIDEGLDEQPEGPMTAADFLRTAAEVLIDRGKSRDDGQERSMARAVRTFNAMTGHELTEEEGWLFMRYLKDSRSRSGEYNRDDYVDGVGYAVLQAECADRDNTDPDEEFDA